MGGWSARANATLATVPAPSAMASRRLTTAPPPIRPSAPRSKLQILQIVKTHRHVLESLRRVVMLHEEMLDAGLLALGENPLPIDAALPHIHHLVLGWARGVFD